MIAKTQEKYFNYDRSCHVLYDKIKRRADEEDARANTL